MSEDIVWGVIRNNSSYLVKRNGITFDSSPYNTKCLNSKANSSLVNRKVLGITQEGGKLYVVTGRKHVNQPAKAVNMTPLSRNNKKNKDMITRFSKEKNSSSIALDPVINRYEKLFRIKVRSSKSKRKSKK